MKTKLIERPKPLKNAVELIPESDEDVIKLGYVYNNSDPKEATLQFNSGHLMHLYITVEALVNAACNLL